MARHISALKARINRLTSVADELKAHFSEEWAMLSDGVPDEWFIEYFESCYRFDSECADDMERLAIAAALGEALTAMKAWVADGKPLSTLELKEVKHEQTS